MRYVYSIPILILFIVCIVESNGQDLSVYLLKNKKELSECYNSDIKANNLKISTIPAVSSYAFNAVATDESFLLVRYDHSGIGALNESGLQKIIFRSKSDNGFHDDGEALLTLLAGQWQDNEVKDFPVQVIEIDRYLAHRSIIEMELVFSDSLSKYKYFTFQKRWEPYGIANKQNGIWMPIGLLSTDLSSADTEGLSLAIIPVGLSYGWKINSKRQPEKYKGISATISWLLRKELSNDNFRSVDKEIFVQAFSIGSLIDINDYLYLGLSYGMDFSRNRDHPGLLFTMGMGSNIIHLLKGTK